MPIRLPTTALTTATASLPPASRVKTTFDEMVVGMAIVTMSPWMRSGLTLERDRSFAIPKPMAGVRT